MILGSESWTGHAGHVPACHGCDDTPIIPTYTVTKYVVGNLACNNGPNASRLIHHIEILLSYFTFPSCTKSKILVRQPKRLMVHEPLTWVQQQCCDWSHEGAVAGFVSLKSHVKAAVMHLRKGGGRCF